MIDTYHYKNIQCMSTLTTAHAQKRVCDLTSSPSHTKNNSHAIDGSYIQERTLYTTDA